MGDPSSSLGAAEIGRYGAQLSAIVFCWLLLAFSSLSEAALVRMELVRARQLAAERGWAGRILLSLVERRQEVLSTLIVLINVGIIGASAYTTEVAIAISGGDKRWITGASVGMIAFLLVFCEVTPKTYAVRRRDAVALAIAPVLGFTNRVVNPIGRVLHAVGMVIIGRVLVPILGGQAIAAPRQYSDQEMMDLVVEGHANGDIEQEEREMIAGVIEFADKLVREVMTPRTDMVCVATFDSLGEAAEVSRKTGYSRLPVCEGDVDHVVGILYAKDLAAAVLGGRSEVTAAEIARKPPPLVPESKKVGELLHLMQRRRLHMAIVIDEYGGTAGLVTIEDLLEEIFGEIRDEHDVEGEPIRALDERTVIADGRVSVDEVEAYFGVNLPEGDFDSVGGFVLDQLGRLPTAGETVVWRSLALTVEEVGGNRIQRLRIVHSPGEGIDEEEDDTEQ
jgi:putative hemolysin